MSASNDVNYSVKGYEPAATTLVYVDKMHLYGGVVGANAVSSSFGPF